jgi:hypothetical protein
VHTRGKEAAFFFFPLFVRALGSLADEHTMAALSPASSTTLNHHYSTPPPTSRPSQDAQRSSSCSDAPRDKMAATPGSGQENTGEAKSSSPLLALARPYEPETPTAAAAAAAAAAVGVGGGGTTATATATRPRPHSRILSGPQLSPLKILQDRTQRNEDGSGSDEQSPKPSGGGGAITRTTTTTTTAAAAAPPSFRSARKIFSPERRFPIKVNGNAPPTPSPVEETPRARPRAFVQDDRTTPEREMTLEDAIKENAGLKHAIEIFEDDIDVHASSTDDEAEAAAEEEEEAEESHTMTNGAFAAQLQAEALAAANEEDGMAAGDDTMMSTFSTFSAVPNLTMFAHLGTTSPPKEAALGHPPSRTPRAGPLPDRGTGGGGSGLARPSDNNSNNNNTTSLLDFTEQLRFQSQLSPGRRGRASPTKGDFMTPQVQRQQQRKQVNLLDFDIPPLPTPRSIPSITPRELESLKSAFLSEISSLKASLSGKEAEVHSLKSAVGDAEKRVGESLEQLREEKAVRASLAAEREMLDKRGREMEGVLRKVKGEIVLLQREREELDAKLDEAEARREAAEMMAQEAESKMAGMRAGKASAESAAAAAAGGGGSTMSPEKSRSPGGSAASNKEVEMAVERVARELHALYKGKHETKVAALKKSYENRWEKRVRELEGKIDELARDNDELRLGRDATMTRVDPARLAQEEEARKEHAAREAAQIRELHAEVEKLEAVVSSVQGDNGELRGLLERERVEKGELVILAEELMAMQQSFVASSSSSSSAGGDGGATRTTTTTTTAAAASNGGGRNARAAGGGTVGTPVSNHHHNTTTMTAASSRPKRRSSTSARASGLKPPGSNLPGPVSESRLARPKSMAIGSAQRSGIMSSIEKMGSYRGRGGE